MLSAHEVYACDNITVVPGAVYTANNIRVKRITAPDFGLVSLEPCCGTHVNSTSELKHFCIVKFSSAKMRAWDILAHCGEAAGEVKMANTFLSRESLSILCFPPQIRQNGQELLRSVDELESNAASTVADYEKQLHLFGEVKRLRKCFSNHDSPYVVKANCIEKLEKLDKSIGITLRHHERSVHTSDTMN